MKNETATDSTTPQLTESEVAEIEARANAASKGDWTIRGGSWVDGGLRLAGYGIRFADSSFEGYEGWDARTNFPPETPEGKQASADRAFLAHARVDIPALIRDWRALRAELGRMPLARQALMQLDELRAANTRALAENAALREQLAQKEREFEALNKLTDLHLKPEVHDALERLK